MIIQWAKKNRITRTYLFHSFPLTISYVSLHFRFHGAYSINYDPFALHFAHRKTKIRLWNSKTTTSICFIIVIFIIAIVVLFFSFTINYQDFFVFCFMFVEFYFVRIFVMMNEPILEIHLTWMYFLLIHFFQCFTVNLCVREILKLFWKFLKLSRSIN